MGRHYETSTNFNLNTVRNILNEKEDIYKNSQNRKKKIKEINPGKPIIKLNQSDEKSLSIEKKIEPIVTLILKDNQDKKEDNSSQNTSSSPSLSDQEQNELINHINKNDFDKEYILYPNLRSLHKLNQNEEIKINNIFENESLNYENFQGKTTILEQTTEIETIRNTFCVSADGCEDSEYAFEIVTEDLIKNSSDKLLLAYIFDSTIDNTNNFRNRKETIIHKYSTKILKMIQTKVNFIKEELKSGIHPIDQLHKISIDNNSEFLVTGFYSLRGPKGDNKQLNLGVDYLLSNSKKPTILIKENSLRKNKQNRQLKWLFIFDKAYFKSYSIFEKFISLVDPNNDFVYGYTVMPSWFLNDDIKNSFMNDIKKNNIKNFDYLAENYQVSSAKPINEKINFGDIHFDYVVFYNNPQKHKVEGKNSSVLNIILNSKSNICFVNGV